MCKNVGMSRRTVLRSVPVAAALIAAEGLPTPRRAFADALPLPQPFPQPPVWSSTAPVVDWRLKVAFTPTFVPGLGDTYTRTYGGMLPGPTLRLRRGQTMRLTQINALPPNGLRSCDHNTPHDFNTFNLHTHGLHVSPSGNADNVLVEFPPKAAEGLPDPEYVSEIEIPDDHPAGTFWYHPHKHGAVATQLAGGMAGVLIIEDDETDELPPEITDAADVVVCINELKLKDGQVPLFVKDDSLSATASTFTVNGQVNPVITVQPGEVQRWRLVAATGFTRLTVRIDGDTAAPYPVEMRQIAQDGITFPAAVRKNEVLLAQGSRADVMVRFDEPGQYRLRSGEVTLMSIAVAGPRVDPPMGLPTELKPGKPILTYDDITDPFFSRTVSFGIAKNAFPMKVDFPHAYRVLGTCETPSATGDRAGDLEYGRFDPDYVNHTLSLGEVERWVIGKTYGHPFHLHTNHFLVVSQDGVALDPPVWQDTVSAVGDTEILVKYEHFTGRTVLHCHNVVHEDQGMMQLIEFVEG